MCECVCYYGCRVHGVLSESVGIDASVPVCVIRGGLGKCVRRGGSSGLDYHFPTCLESLPCYKSKWSDVLPL